MHFAHCYKNDFLLSNSSKFHRECRLDRDLQTQANERKFWCNSGVEIKLYFGLPLQGSKAWLALRAQHLRHSEVTTVV